MTKTGIIKRIKEIEKELEPLYEIKRVINAFDRIKNNPNINDSLKEEVKQLFQKIDSKMKPLLDEVKSLQDDLNNRVIEKSKESSRIAKNSQQVPYNYVSFGYTTDNITRPLIFTDDSLILYTPGHSSYLNRITGLKYIEAYLTIIKNSDLKFEDGVFKGNSFNYRTIENFKLKANTFADEIFKLIALPKDFKISIPEKGYFFDLRTKK